MNDTNDQPPDRPSVEEWFAHTRTCLQSPSTQNPLLLIARIGSTLEEPQQRQLSSKLRDNTCVEHREALLELISELDRQMWFSKMADRFTHLVEEIQGFKRIIDEHSVKAKRWFFEAELVRQDQWSTQDAHERMSSNDPTTR
jgi:hypothetical protein